MTWRGFIDGEPVALELEEVRRRWPRSYETHWLIELPVVQLAKDAGVARDRAESRRHSRKGWIDVAGLW